jgi:hypothetical protein
MNAHDGTVDLPILDGGQSIGIKLRGELRKFNGGPQLPLDQVPEDPTIIAASYTVLGVMADGEMVAHAGWNEQGWFGDIKRGSWEADLMWALT